MKEIIRNYLINFAKENQDFNFDERKLGKCLDYITSEAKKVLNGKSGAIEDKVVFGWAVHFYDEQIEVPEEKKPAIVSTPTFEGKTVRLKAEGGYEEVKPTPKKKDKKVKEKNYEEVSLF